VQRLAHRGRRWSSSTLHQSWPRDTRTAAHELGLGPVVLRLASDEENAAKSSGNSGASEELQHSDDLHREKGEVSAVATASTRSAASCRQQREKDGIAALLPRTSDRGAGATSDSTSRLVAFIPCVG
jgi:hypothetical protein